MYEDEIGPLDIDAQFVSTFKITAAEKAAFFEEHSAVEDPFTPGPPALDELVELLLISAPPEVPSVAVIQSEVPHTETLAREEQAKLELPLDLLDRIRGELVVTIVTIRQLVTLLRLGKNVILTGPPGTGKTTLAHNLARLATLSDADADHFPVCAGSIPTTATADWTTFDTIGGYVPAIGGASGLEFREGLFLQAIRQYKWLLIDELNRADVDKAFGQLFTVLSGQEVELPFRAENGQNFSIRRKVSSATSNFEASESSYTIGSDWRIIATMNTFDRSHLFQLSSAFVRRFAVVNVPVPTLDELEGWLQARDLDGWVLARVRQLITVLQVDRPLGPALLGDFVEYVSLRLEALPNAEMVFHATETSAIPIVEVEATDAVDGIAFPNQEVSVEDPFLEAVIAFILPQMDGLDIPALERIRTGLRSVIAPSSGEELERHFRDLFRI